MTNLGPRIYNLATLRAMRSIGFRSKAQAECAPLPADDSVAPDIEISSPPEVVERDAATIEFLRLAQDVVRANDCALAAELAQQHIAPENLQGADDDVINAWADLAYTAKNYDLASRFYEFLAAKNYNGFWSHFQLGRINNHLRQYEVALQWLTESCRRAPTFAWSWYELSISCFSRKDVSALARAAVGLCSSNIEQLNSHHKEFLVEAAHFLFENRLREEPYRLYHLLLAQGVTDDMVRTRHAEYFIWKQNFGLVIELLEPHWRKKTLGDWGRRALAQALFEVGRQTESLSIFAELVDRQPRNVLFLKDYLKFLCEADLRDEAQSAFEKAQTRLSESAYENMQAFFLGVQGDFRQLLRWLRENPSSKSEEIRTILDRSIGYAAYKTKDYAVGNELIDIRLARYGFSEPTWLCRMSIAFGSRNWDMARRLLDETQPCLFDENVEFRVKRFEYYCFVGDTKEAIESLRSLEPLNALPRRFLMAVLRFYGEIGNWEALLSVAQLGFDETFDFAAEGELLLRAIRKLSAHMRILGILRKNPLIDMQKSLARLYATVLEDFRGIISSEDWPPSHYLPESVRGRLVFKKLVAKVPSRSQPNKNVIYYCANPSYLCASFVSITSLIESNRDLIEDTDIMLAVDDPNAIVVATRIAAKLSKACGMGSISIVPKQKFLSESVQLKTAYGIFTAGQTLAEAAYYRIYFAKYLLEQRRYEKALYIDADTVVIGDLNPLFSEGGAALRAKPEIKRPEIEHAIKHHGLEAGRYFNSGVLLFNLRHQKILEGLEGAIMAAQTLHKNLFFQDQCALNIGFKGIFEDLRSEYNSFIWPKDTAPSADGAILHFLDRPKPWDALYDGKLCRLWFLSWHKLAKYVGEADAVELYNLTKH